MPTVEKLLLGTQATLLTGTALNNLLNNALVLGSVFDNTVGAAGDGYRFGILVCTFKFQVAPTANTGLSVWLLKTGDAGTTYEDGGTTFTPLRPPDAVIPVSADTNAHVVALEVELPAGKFKPLIKNDGTGQSLTANNVDNVLLLTPFTREGV